MSDSEARRAALIARLASEFDDQALAIRIADNTAADTIDRLAALAHGLFHTTALLSFTAPARDEIESLVVFAFGNRVDDDVATPGPVNVALAAATEAFLCRRGVPVFAQWEVARGIAGEHAVVSIEPATDANGEATYLSTAGVVAGAQRLALERGIGLGTVGVIAFRDHAPRCVATVRAAGIEAGVPSNVALPDRYDSTSGQSWTRQRACYIATDLLARAFSPDLIWS